MHAISSTLGSEIKLGYIYPFVLSAGELLLAGLMSIAGDMNVQRCWCAAYLPTRFVYRAPGLFHPVPLSLIEGLEVEYPEDMEIDDVANGLLDSHVYTWFSDDDVQPQPGSGMARL